MAKIPKASAPTVGLTTEIDPSMDVLWAPQPGPQTMAMLADHYEIFLGGAKGGGKSFAIIGWLIKGNPEVPMAKATPIDLSYINCKTYRALVVRKNLDDLNSWIAEAGKVYGTDGRSGMGANYTQRPNEFTFPTGAKIIMGHLDDDNAAEKYFGNVVHRAAVDELTFIDSYKNYMKLMSCVRSNVVGIRAQMLLTGNPGGPGTPWVKERFVKPRDENGEIVPPLTTIKESSWNPFLKRMVDTTRIFIPSKLKDNPKMIESDPTYWNRLMMMDEAERLAYLEGDWDSLGGTMFGDFRAYHRAGEPPDACHVIPSGSRGFKPWLPRFMALDWGYEHASAFLKAIRDLNGQTVIRKELSANHTAAIDWGRMIARECISDLNELHGSGASPLITLWLSPDAFGKRDEGKTPAEKMAQGISEILGPKSVHMPDFFPVQAADGSAEFFSQRNLQGMSGITICRAQNARISGAEHVREMLRWRRMLQSKPEDFDPELAARLLHESQEKHRAYVENHRRKAPEVLPKLLIEDCCRNLIDSIPALVRKENTEDVLKTENLADDFYDCLRYLLTSQDAADNREPEQSVVHRHLQQVREWEPDIDMNGLIWAARHAESLYANSEQSEKPFNVPLESSRAFKHRKVQ